MPEEEPKAWYKLNEKIGKKLKDLGKVKNKKAKEINDEEYTKSLRKIVIPKKGVRQITSSEIDNAVKSFLEKGGKIKKLKPFDVITGDRDSLIEDENERNDYLEKTIVFNKIDGLLPE